MSPTRRQVLAWGLTGAGLAAAGGAGLWWATNAATGDGESSRPEPSPISSSGGLLELELQAAPGAVIIDGREAFVHAYNGSLPGPTLRVRQGDTLRIRLGNRLDAPTNLHVHGLHVSPLGNSDNPFVSVAPGGFFDYEFRIPDEHPPGTYWYHPHHHGHVADQIAAGLYGGIVVEDRVPIPVTRERVLLISDLSLDGSGNLAPVSAMERMSGREGELVLVNGQVRPRLAAAPGERERWRIINACPARFLRLNLVGQQVQLLARDFGRLPTPLDITEVELAPGNRVELLVEAQEGRSTFISAPVDRGTMPGMMMGGQQPGSNGEPVPLLDLDVTGSPVPAPPPVPTAPAPRDLRTEPVAESRTLDFAMGGMGGGMMGGGGGNRTGMMMAFTINGREFAHDRLDTPVQSGSIEEWTLTNSSSMDHPIHLHVWPMQVIQDRGQDLPEPLWLDVVNVPAFSQVTVRIPFEDFTGRTVYHCHILDHEDLGMMGTVEARPAGPG